jgi:putative Mg2+ transporter-C (MgtC) family protein
MMGKHDVDESLNLYAEKEALGMDSYAVIIFKVLTAVALGGSIGYEREHHNQPAGLKTHIILCVGATLLTIVSIAMSNDLGNDRLTDPTRIAAQIVSGIGFLGGGAILRLGATVRGLTTAACIWTVTGVGMAIGAGYYFPAALVILTMLLTLHYMERFENLFFKKREFKAMSLTARSSPELLGRVEKVLTKNHISIKSIELERELTEPNVELRALLSVPGQVSLHRLSDEMFQIPGTIRFEME